MQGGTYINEGGELRRVGGTEDHPEGNRARDAEGVRLNRPAEAPAEGASTLPTSEQQRHRAGGKKTGQTNNAPASGADKEA